MNDTVAVAAEPQPGGKKGVVSGDWTVTIEGTPEVRTAAREAGYKASHAAGFVYIDIVGVPKPEAEKIAGEFGKVIRVKSAGLLLGG